tara:strand:+ start:50 stop:697 length:648 start_codon:yes stop_codon:yes gene_type:complete
MNISKTKEPNQAAHDYVYKALRTKIMHGEVLPATSMTLRGIAQDYSVSMTPAREALRRLIAEGALMLSPSGRVSTAELNHDRIEELAVMRSLIEVELASRALPRAHIALIDRLKTMNASVSQAIAAHDPVAYIKTNLEFHRMLYLRAQAPAMLAIAETVWLQLGPTMRSLYGKLNRKEPPHSHTAIIAALHAGDEPGLRLAVRSDVTHGLRHLLK